MSFAAGGQRVSDAEIAQVAYNAGFRSSALTQMVARAFVESSGYADIINDSSGAAGIWQILPAAHPEYAKQLPPNTGWENPQTNANMAYAIYVAAGNSFSPWASDGSAWLVYMQRATTAVNAINTSGGGSTGTTTTPGTVGTDPTTGTIQDASLTSGITGAVNFFTDPHNYFRVAMFVLGGALLLWGVWELMKDTSVGKAVKSTAKDAAVAAAL